MKLLNFNRKLIILAASITTINSSFGFNFNPSSNSPWIHTSTTSNGFISATPSFMTATSHKEMEDTTLTDLDEQILFGDSSSTSNKKIPFPSPKRHRTRTGNLLPPTNVQPNPLDHSESNALINKLNSVRQTLQSCPQIWSELAKYCPDYRALLDTHLCDTTVDLTFSQADEMVRKSAAVFKDLGVTRGVNIAILGENSAYWLLVDHGIQMNGGSSAVRGADAPLDELKYIYEHSESAGVVVLQGPRLLARLKADAEKKGAEALGLKNEKHGPVKTIILMHREKKSNEEITEIAKELGLTVLVFSDLLDATDPIKSADLPVVGLDDLSTIVYTSGTTGQPKGVMLTHGNLIHQSGHRLFPTKSYDETEPIPGELMLSLLPVWHITERTFELWMLTRGCSVVYSTIRSFKKDLAKYKPQWLVLVPRVLEKVASGVQDKFASGSTVARALVKVFTATSGWKYKQSKVVKGLTIGEEEPNFLDVSISWLIVTALRPLNFVGDKLVWKKVKDGFGGRVKVIISGGSALAGSLETFYETCGLSISVGYGLTECSPLIAHRRVDSNLVTAGCVGQPCLDTELRVVDPEVKPDDIQSERPALPDGEVGVVVARGPQVMTGYYRNLEATNKAIDRFGFFDTGDLGRINPSTGDLILTGRCKDTIVLSNGENIEPSPIEDAILSQSSLIEQIMLTGQDGRSLTAILVLNPNELINSGFLDQKKGEILQQQNEDVNDPKCAVEESKSLCEVLSKASEMLRENDSLQSTIMADIREATSDFRKWEQVQDIYITLEPFAMSNGLLTQSYKVKRDAVVNRYSNVIQ